MRAAAAVAALCLLAAPTIARGEQVFVRSPPAPGADGTAPIAAASPDDRPLAGVRDGLFYLRDPDDDFRLYVQGRAQIDGYSFWGPGVSSLTGLKPTLFLRRVRPEISGEIVRSWAFTIAGDFGATGIDNGSPKTPQVTKVSAAPTDVFVIYRGHPLFHVQVGQFDAPFTMENRTSDKYIPFMERSLAVRMGIPSNKEIGAMVWGEDKDRVFAYALGLFDGDGQNRTNVDARGDGMARVFVHPLTGADHVLRDLQIGGSVRYGSRDPRFVSYDYAGLSTQGQFTYWSPTYAGTKGVTHVIPAGSQVGAAGELRVPVSFVDFTGEVVWIDNHTREAIEGFQATNTERFGAMTGYAYYAQFGLWLTGDRDVNGLPGYENPPHLDFDRDRGKPRAAPNRALQVLFKWEQLALTYRGASRGGVTDPKNADGRIRVDAFSVGANYWATKHIRLTANVIADVFPSSEPTSPTTAGGPSWSSRQRAQAPGNTLPVGKNDVARDTAHTLYEVLFRVAVAL